jgi:hypothetical protein
MRKWRIVGGLVVLAAAYWADASHFNRWVSTFLTVVGCSLLVLGAKWLTPEEPGRPGALGIEYGYRVALGVVAALLSLCLLFPTGWLETSAGTAWLALYFFTYRAPWLPRPSASIEASSS